MTVQRKYPTFTLAQVNGKLSYFTKKDGAQSETNTRFALCSVYLQNNTVSK